MRVAASLRAILKLRAWQNPESVVFGQLVVGEQVQDIESTNVGAPAFVFSKGIGPCAHSMGVWIDGLASAPLLLVSAYMGVCVVVAIAFMHRGWVTRFL